MDDIITKEDSLLNVDKNFCVGCGLCTKVASEKFCIKK